MKKGMLGVMVFLIIIMFNIPIEYAKEENEKSNLIYVVYDDSRSMYCEDGVNPEEYYNQWGQAKYSISVFAGMMGENDMMKIYPFSGGGNQFHSIEKNMKSMDRVRSIENNLNKSYAKSTDFQVVESVTQQLKNDTSDAKKWLIIITDGIFEKNKVPIKSGDELKSNFHTIICDDINYVYLNIGKNSISLSEDMGDNFYTYSASDSNAIDGNSDILKNLTYIANLIFEHQSLNKFIPGNEKVTFDIDAPVKKIIVFAQGENTEIGKLKYKGKKSKNYDCTDVVNIKGSGENDIPNELKNIFKNKEENEQVKILDSLSASSLQGEISTYSLKKGEQFNLGQYELEVNNFKELEIYYELDVDLSLKLFQIDDKGKKIIVDSKNKPFYGKELYVTTEWLNHNTKKKVDSKLIDESKIKYTIMAKMNGKEILESYTKDDIKIDKLNNGDLEIYATATFPDGIVLQDSYKSKIYKIVKTKLKFNGFEESVRTDEIEKNPITITITKENGESFTKEEWDDLEVKVKEVENLNTKIIKNNDKKTCTLTIESASEGKMNLNVNVSGKNGSIIYEGNDVYKIEIRSLSLYEHFLKNLIWFVIVVAIAIVGWLWYKFKPRIPRSLKARVQIDGEQYDFKKGSVCKVNNIKNNILPCKKPTAELFVSYLDGEIPLFKCEIGAEKRDGENRIYISNVYEICHEIDYEVCYQSGISIDDSENKMTVNNDTTLVLKNEETSYYVRFYDIK